MQVFVGFHHHLADKKVVFNHVPYKAVVDLIVISSRQDLWSSNSEGNCVYRGSILYTFCISAYKKRNLTTGQNVYKIDFTVQDNTMA